MIGPHQMIVKCKMLFNRLRTEGNGSDRSTSGIAAMVGETDRKMKAMAMEGERAEMKSGRRSGVLDGAL